MSGAPGPAGERVDVGALLTIDVDAELRKLATAQLQGPWQIPAELARRALGAGAAAVEIHLGRGRVTVDDDGAAIADAILRDLAVLLDPQAPADRRHSALTDLEAAGQGALLALAGLHIDALTITTAAAGAAPQRLTLRRGRPPIVAAAGPPAKAPRTSVDLHAGGLEAARARAFLADVGAYAGPGLKVDGVAIGDGLRRALATAPIALGGGPRPIRGQIAIARGAGEPRLYLLQHGIVTTHQSLTQAPAFDAVLELGPHADARASAADLRGLIEPVLGDLVEEAVDLMLAVAERTPRLGPEAQSRVRSLLLQSARLGRRRAEVEAAPIIPCVQSHDAAPVFRSLRDLRQAAEAEPGGPSILPALYPGQSSDEVILGGPPLVILDAAARSTITEVYGLRFRPPSRQPRARGALHRRVGERLADGLAAALVALRIGVGPRLADDALTADERALVDHLRALLPSCGPEAPREVHFCRGRGPVRRIGGPEATLLLPRDDPEVRRSVAALARSPAWIYPIALALLRGHGMPSPGARSTWLRDFGRR
ncbi:MAG: hypothetical protein R3B09_02100 [Nannocystaceae bacterium]